MEKAFSNVKFNNDNEEPQSKMRWNGTNQESNLNKETKSKHKVPSTVYHKWNKSFPCFPGTTGRFNKLGGMQ